MDGANEKARTREGLVRAAASQSEEAARHANFEEHRAEPRPIRKPSFDPDVVEAFRDAGLALLPLNGKKPFHPAWTRKKYDSRAEAEAAEGKRNLGVQLTAEVMVLDADPRHYVDGVDSLEMLATDLGIDLSAFARVETGGGGVHLYMWKDPTLRLPPNLAKAGYPGLDLKTKGGQVVAPGSIHPETGRPYVGEDLAFLLAMRTPVPQALVELVHRERPPVESASHVEPGVWTPDELAQNLANLAPDDFPDHDRWFEVMQSAHYATNGEGFEEFAEWCDEYTGSNGTTRDELAKRWRSLAIKPGCITHKLICKLLHDRNVRVHDESPPELDFDVVEDQSTVDRAAERRWRFLSVEELEALPPPRWLVAGLLVEGSIAAIYGAPESGKSFLAVDVAMSIASGLAWHGRTVTQGAALYVAAEGAPGIGKRIRAWHIDRGARSGALPFSLMGDPLNMATEREAKEFARAVCAELGELRLVVIDTLNQTATGADENSAQDMGRYIAGMKALRDATGATVVVVHHSGKDVSRGMRGSTALLGAMDTTLEVERSTDGGSIEVRVRKQKDAERDPPMRFNLDKVADSLVLRPTLMADAAEDFGRDPIRRMAVEMASGGRLALKDLVAAVMERDGVADKTARRRIEDAIPEGRDSACGASDGHVVWRERADGNSRGSVVVRVEAEAAT